VIVSSTVPPAFLRTIEDTAFSIWLRESPDIFGMWFILSFHALGMALLVGASLIVALRVLGIARDLPLPFLRRLYPLLWAGFWIQIVSGVLLFIGYPTKSFMTPAFWVKLAFIAAAMVVVVRLGRKVPGEGTPALAIPGMRSLASWTLVLWFGAITAGRLIAYTAKYITYP
jgi:hypothetical protein